MWSTEKNRPTPNETWNPLTGKPVAPDETAKPRTTLLSNEKPDSAFPAHARKKAICVLCSEPSAEMICGACADKVRAAAVEHKRREEKGGRRTFGGNEPSVRLSKMGGRAGSETVDRELSWLA
jgi:hypothetical protein